MRFVVARLVLLYGFLALSGCGMSVPNCDDAGTIEDVKSIVEDRYDDDPAFSFGGSVVVEIKNVRTAERLKTNEKKCTATAVLIPPQRAPKSFAQKEEAITYHIAPAKDGLSYSILIDWP